jgi:hypothetical protein
MRISSGIAEIGLSRLTDNRIASEKFYLWPLYNAGKVQEIHGVTRWTDSNAVYTKPSSEDREKILALSRDNTNLEYSSYGNISKAASGIRPGSLFDAIV